jgi:hypothetical protein
MLFSGGPGTNKLDRAQTVRSKCVGERRFDTFWTDSSVKPFKSGSAGSPNAPTGPLGVAD